MWSAHAPPHSVPPPIIATAVRWSAVGSVGDGGTLAALMVPQKMYACTATNAKAAMEGGTDDSDGPRRAPTRRVAPHRVVSQ